MNSKILLNLQRCWDRFRHKALGHSQTLPSAVAAQRVLELHRACVTPCNSLFQRSGCSLLVCNVISPGVCVAALGRRPNMQQASCSHVANLHDAADADENEVEEEEELVIAVDKRRMIELRNLGVPQRKVQAQSESTSDMYRIIVFYYFARRTHLVAAQLAPARSLGRAPCRQLVRR